MVLHAEFYLCVLAALIAWPVAKDIAARYALFAVMAMILGQHEYWDATILSGAFAAYAMIDCMTGMAKGRTALFVSSTVWIALSLESMALLDYMLSNLVYIDAIINAWLIFIVAKEWSAWRRTSG